MKLSLYKKTSVFILSLLFSQSLPAAATVNTPPAKPARSYGRPKPVPTVAQTQEEFTANNEEENKDLFKMSNTLCTQILAFFLFPFFGIVHRQGSALTRSLYALFGIDVNDVNVYYTIGLLVLLGILVPVVIRVLFEHFVSGIRENAMYKTLSPYLAKKLDIKEGSNEVMEAAFFSLLGLALGLTKRLTENPAIAVNARQGDTDGFSLLSLFIGKQGFLVGNNHVDPVVSRLAEGLLGMIAFPVFYVYVLERILGIPHVIIGLPIETIVNAFS